MQVKDQEWIERYFAGELTEAERAILESRMVEDPIFKNEVEQYQLIIGSLQLKRRGELLDRFKEKDRIVRRIIPWKSLAAAFLVICGAFWLWNSQNSSPEINEYVAPIIDSNNIHEKEMVFVDSVVSNSKPTEREEKDNDSTANIKNRKPIIPKSIEQPIANNKFNHEELYAMNFEPYKDETMNLNLRGEDAISPYDQFVKNYWSGKYQVVIDSFSTLNTALQKNDNVLFVKANALMATDRFEEAILILENIIKSDKSRYKMESRWNLGLCYLKKNELIKAKEQFRIIKSLNNPKYNKAVDKLLKQI